MIIMKVGGGCKLVFPPDTPPAYKGVAEACMATDPNLRPKFEEVLEVLDYL